MKKLIVLVFLLAFLPAKSSFGQTFDSLYGLGVHQFFNGCDTEAIQIFDAVIATYPDDPRSYYFRGLAKMRSGDSYSAQADFQLGAEMEAVGNRRSSVVNRSLERIQGPTRMCIEQARDIALNPALRTTQNFYGYVPDNSVYDANEIYPSVAPATLPLTDYPPQSTTESFLDDAAPPMPGEVELADPAALNTTAASTEVAPVVDPVTVPESTPTTPAQVAPTRLLGCRFTERPNYLRIHIWRSRFRSTLRKLRPNHQPIFPLPQNRVANPLWKPRPR